MNNNTSPILPCSTQDRSGYWISSDEGRLVRRIRTPHPHDVLAGRGGGINSHPGNRRFREWVKQRKNCYNLAPSKADKARVAKEVIALVHALNPPGRFLQRDTTSSSAGGGWWVEIDGSKAFAKTSQALREGAPTIRAQHQQDLEKNRKAIRRKDKNCCGFTEDLTVSTITPTTYSGTVQAVSPTLAPTTIIKPVSPDMESSGTPTLIPAINDNMPPAISLDADPSPAPQTVEWKIDTGDLKIDEFVNPFENEEETIKQLYAKSHAIFRSFSGAFPTCAMCGLPIEKNRGCLCCSLPSGHYNVHDSPAA